MGRGEPDEAGVGGSARLTAPSASWGWLGGDSISSSRWEESELPGGIIKGITGSRSPLRPSAVVTGTKSMATVTTPGAATLPSVSPWVTITSSPDLASSSFLLTTSGVGGVVGAGMVDGKVVGGVVGSGPAVVMGGVVGADAVVGL